MVEKFLRLRNKTSAIEGRILRWMWGRENSKWKYSEMAGIAPIEDKLRENRQRTKVVWTQL